MYGLNQICENVITKSLGSNNYSNGFSGVKNNSYLINCIFLGGGIGFSSSNYTTDTVYIQNCVFIGGVVYSIILYSGMNLEMHNTILVPAVSDGLEIGTGTLLSSSNNASSDDLVTTHGIGTITDVSDADFLDPTNDDYHLSPTSQLIDAGLNLIVSGDLDSPQYDIDGEQWPDTGDWCIGFDWREAAAPEQSVIPLIFYYRQMRK